MALFIDFWLLKINILILEHKIIVITISKMLLTERWNGFVKIASIENELIYIYMEQIMRRRLSGKQQRLDAFKSLKILSRHQTLRVF